MSIDAVIGSVVRKPDGTAVLHLLPRQDSTGQWEGPGQNSLTVLNPPDDLEVVVGAEIWGGSESIIVGKESKWADRVGYTKIRLVPSLLFWSEESCQKISSFSQETLEDVPT